jgi:hypothetical protein
MVAYVLEDIHIFKKKKSVNMSHASGLEAIPIV